MYRITRAGGSLQLGAGRRGGGAAGRRLTCNIDGYTYM